MAIIGKWSLNGNSNAQVGSNGTSTNVTWVDGKSNGAGSFNGSSSYIEAPGSFTTNQNITASCMVKITTNPTGQSKLLVILGGNQYLATIYYVTISGVQYIRMSDTTDNVYTATHTINLAGTGWRNIGVTKIGTTQQIYVDGIPVGTTGNSGTNTVPSTPDIISIGRTANFPTQYFNGLIDEVEIDNTALSTAGMRNKALYYNGFI